MDLSGRYIGYRLRDARKRMNLSQEQVKRALGFRSANRISQWENGIRLPGVRNLIKLTTLYKTPVEELFYEIRQEAVASIDRFLKEEYSDKDRPKERPP